MSDNLVFGSFRRERARANEMDCIGKIPSTVKVIAKDFTVVGDVRVEKEFDTDGTYRVDVKPRPVMVDLNLFYIAMKKHDVSGFFIDPSNKSFYFHVNQQ